MEIRSGVLRFDDGTDGMKDVFQILVCLVQLKIQVKHNISIVIQMNKKSTEKVKKCKENL